MFAHSQAGRDVSTPRIIALTGFMGSGKTKVGRALADLLRWSFVDLDAEIELQHKMRIRELFRRHGEPQFRELETGALRQLLREVSTPTVIALGGGTFIHAHNTDLLRDSGAQVVFLETPIEEMIERCRIGTPSSAENLRPLAADPDAFRALYVQRLPSYRKADLTFNTAGRTAEENALEIAARLQLGASA